MDKFGNVYLKKKRIEWGDKGGIEPMKNKNELQAISLVVALFGLFILSMFINNDAFLDIVASVPLPLLLLTIANIAVSALDDIVDRAERTKSAQGELIPLLNHLLHLIKYELDGAKDDDSKKAWSDWTDKYTTELDSVNYTIEVCGDVVSKIEAFRAFKAVYVCAYVLLFLGLTLSTVIAPYLQFVTHPAFALLSLSLAVSVALLKDRLANKIHDKLLGKIIAEKENP